jgi:KUP system potassium uptake protein
VNSSQSKAALAVAALGVVFGDIGTSPLYTLKTCFTTANVPPTLENILGIVSLLTWALIVVVCIKYVTILMRVDNDGEGGILALLALAAPPKLLGAAKKRWLVVVVVIGAAMLIGDGMITPAISVISAVEGIAVSTSAAQPFVVPISAGLLLALFLIQSRGTQSVGFLFGPVMILWFLAIGVAGGIAIAAYPRVLGALNPWHAIFFVAHHGVYGFLVFGAVILCLTGAEALYADMSHFGRIPVTLAWYGLVLPALLLNYFGQGAHLLANGDALDSPFFALTPGWTLLPIVVLATAATVIASQSLISGAFTLAEQAIALHLSPRFLVKHTSESQRGQVYVPFINVLLAVVCLVLVVTFRSSDRLASAYGLAVAVTMLATSITFYVVATTVLKWRKRFAIPVMGVFLAIDAVFVAAGLPKFMDGAWVPLAIAAVISLVSLTWLAGRRALATNMALDQLPVELFLQQHPRPENPTGTMVLLTRDARGVPFVAQHTWLLPVMAEESIVLLSLAPVGRPYIEEDHRVHIEQIAPTFAVVHAKFGYMENPRIEPVLRACDLKQFDLRGRDTVFYYGLPTIVARPGGMWKWQRGLFAWLQLVSRPLTNDLMISPDRSVGLGVEVQL